MAGCDCRLFVVCSGRVSFKQQIILCCAEDGIFCFKLLQFKPQCCLPANIITQFTNFRTRFLRLIRSFLMAIIVEKSKKCLDFSFTLFVVHLLIVCVYDGFPSTWDWWIVHIFSMVTMVLLGEYLCARREMEDIPLLQL